MPSVSARAARPLIAGALLIGVTLIPVSAVAAQEPSASPAAVASTAPTASTAPVASPAPSGSTAPADIVFYPLPPGIATIAPDIPTVSIDPMSTESLVIGQGIDFSLGHCGLWSPIDLDGSLWVADGGVTPAGAAIVEGDDAVIGELINATPGVFVLVGEDAAQFTSETGMILSLIRAEGAVDYPLCM